MDTTGHVPTIRLCNASLRYTDATAPVFEKVNLEFPAGKWSVLVGRSGCGKTSLLRYLAGLLDDSQIHWQGQTFIDANQVQQPNLALAYMAQQDLLLPWLNVMDNLCLMARFTPVDKANFEKKALNLLEKVGLKDAAKLYPNQLSGGMRQRIALARTLIQDKPVVLMDEPFSALDAVTRFELQNLAAELLKDKTVVLITHDPQEAYRLGHKVYLMQGSPANLIELEVKDSPMPRVMDGDLARFTQTMLEELGV